MGVSLLALGGIVYEAMTTGKDSLDRLRFPVASGLVRAFGFKVRPAHGRAAMAIIHNETSDNTAPPVIGDKRSPKGPSVGPMQASRARCIFLGLVPADETYESFAARAYDESWCIWAGCKILHFHQFVDESNPEHDLAVAIKLYNGPFSTEYQGAALAWLNEQYGSDALL